MEITVPSFKAIFALPALVVIVSLRRSGALTVNVWEPPPVSANTAPRTAKTVPTMGSAGYAVPIQQIAAAASQAAAHTRYRSNDVHSHEERARGRNTSARDQHYAQAL